MDVDFEVIGSTIRRDRSSAIHIRDPEQRICDASIEFLPSQSPSERDLRDLVGCQLRMQGGWVMIGSIRIATLLVNGRSGDGQQPIFSASWREALRK